MDNSTQFLPPYPNHFGTNQNYYEERKFVATNGSFNDSVSGSFNNSSAISFSNASDNRPNGSFNSSSTYFTRQGSVGDQINFAKMGGFIANTFYMLKNLCYGNIVTVRDFSEQASSDSVKKARENFIKLCTAINSQANKQRIIILASAAFTVIARIFHQSMLAQFGLIVTGLSTAGFLIYCGYKRWKTDVQRQQLDSKTAIQSVQQIIDSIVK